MEEKLNLKNLEAVKACVKVPHTSACQDSDMFVPLVDSNEELGKQNAPVKVSPELKQAIHSADKGELQACFGLLTDDIYKSAGVAGLLIDELDKRKAQGNLIPDAEYRFRNKLPLKRLYDYQEKLAYTEKRGVNVLWVISSLTLLFILLVIVPLGRIPATTQHEGIIESLSSDSVIVSYKNAEDATATCEVPLTGERKIYLNTEEEVQYIELPNGVLQVNDTVTFEIHTLAGHGDSEFCLSPSYYDN